MATTAKVKAKPKERNSIGKDQRTPSSISNTSTLKSITKPSTRSSNDEKATTKVTPSEKQVPNYLRPTISSRLVTHPDKVQKNDTAPQKPTLNRRSNEKLPSTSRLSDRKELSNSRTQKPHGSPVPSNKSRLLLQSSSTRSPNKSSTSPKSISDKILKTHTHGKPRPLMPSKSVNSKEGSKTTAAPSSKKRAGASANLTKAPENADSTAEISRVGILKVEDEFENASDISQVEYELQEFENAFEVSQVEEYEHHSFENASEISQVEEYEHHEFENASEISQVDSTQDEHVHHHKLEESAQPHIQADNESDQPHIQADNESDQPHIPADKESDQPHIQADNESDQPHIQADNESQQPHIQAENESDHPCIQVDHVSNQPCIQPDNDSDQTHIQADNDSDQLRIQDDDERVITRVPGENAVPVTEVEEKGETQEDKTKEEYGEDKSSNEGQSSNGTPPTEREVKAKEKEEEVGTIVDPKTQNNTEEKALEDNNGGEREIIGNHEHVTESEVEKIKTETTLPKRQAVKESQANNDVIEETASKLLEKRKNKVLALVGAFQNVIDHQTSSR